MAAHIMFSVTSNPRTEYLLRQFELETTRTETLRRTVVDAPPDCIHSNQYLLKFSNDNFNLKLGLIKCLTRLFRL